MEMKLKIVAIAKNKWGNPPSLIKTDQLLTEYQFEGDLALIVWAKNPSTDIIIGQVGETFDIFKPIKCKIGECEIDIGVADQADKPSGTILFPSISFKIKR